MLFFTYFRNIKTLKFLITFCLMTIFCLIFISIYIPKENILIFSNSMFFIDIRNGFYFYSILSIIIIFLFLFVYLKDFFMIKFIIVTIIYNIYYIYICLIIDGYVDIYGLHIKSLLIKETIYITLDNLINDFYFKNDGIYNIDNKIINVDVIYNLIINDYNILKNICYEQDVINYFQTYIETNSNAITECNKPKFSSRIIIENPIEFLKKKNMLNDSHLPR
jgi:hypothetical protein